MFGGWVAAAHENVVAGVLDGAACVCHGEGDLGEEAIGDQFEAVAQLDAQLRFIRIHVHLDRRVVGEQHERRLMHHGFVMCDACAHALDEAPVARELAERDHGGALGRHVEQPGKYDQRLRAPTDVLLRR
jgi:hypothetical protein